MFKHYDRFHLDAKYFPESTRKAFPTAFMIKYGVLPLGFKNRTSFFKKTTTLNIGLLNPGTSDMAALQNTARSSLGENSFKELQIYKIDPGEFITILGSAYGVNRDALRLLVPENTHPTLGHYLAHELIEVSFEGL